MDSSAVNHFDVLSFAFGRVVNYEDRPLYINAKDPSRSLCAIQLRRLVRTLIAGLKRHIQQGDCVLVHLGNSYVHPALFFGIIGAGGVYLGASPDSPPYELINVFNLGNPKLIITSSQTLQTVLGVSTSKGLCPEQVCLFEELAITRFLGSSPSIPVGGAGHITMAHFLSHGEEDWIRLDEESLAKTTPAAMYCTSGTSGLPKAAVLSHHAIISQHRNIHYEFPFDVKRLVVIPMYHRFGALWHTFPIRHGEPAYIMHKFEVGQFLKAVQAYQITETHIVPATVHLLNQTSQPVTDFLSSLRMVGVGGAPIDAASLQKFQSLLHSQATAAQTWGMTETGPVFVGKYGERSDKASIGKTIGNNEAKLLDDQGMIINSDGCSGELCVRGTGLLLHYKGRDDGIDREGWFRTGDVAYRQDGYYYLLGRTKEIIKVQGYQVAPAEIEAVLLTHPGINDAAVLGVQSSDKGVEVPRAFVVKSASGTHLAADDVYQFAQSRLAGYKALDGGVVFVTEIPRTVSGKILRTKLAQMNAQRDKVAQILSRRVIKVTS
ncbi:adenylate-forming enzyme AfeA [Aspergillus sclerotioniger CBS 115572]|uniref:Adenylate-forming enzyme AfeA n=1 Tax=Aspergillus sclerotioniger CBS 115572 TaxID=1450535 RepID=A0A317W1I1_9EURO|nr:adenylate-forming enzyme AfeA [Aspergillus sclerotioniger CBS 115572]PWY79461.1 adenylate-forming enzyme AfeA [Aspergillus sclerotioniger CBS 115572]